MVNIVVPFVIAVTLPIRVIMVTMNLRVIAVIDGYHCYSYGSCYYGRDDYDCCYH